jgi:hypothetical protein
VCKLWTAAREAAAAAADAGALLAAAAATAEAVSTAAGGHACNARVQLAQPKEGQVVYLGAGQGLGVVWFPLALFHTLSETVGWCMGVQVLCWAVVQSF